MRYFFLCLLLAFASNSVIRADVPDSAYIFSYATDKNNNTNGLHFAWSIDMKNWNAIGPECSFLKSDFGAWGQQKKLINPCLIQDNEGSWHCIFTLNKEVGQLAHTVSSDLIHWKPQSYPVLLKNGNVQDIEVKYDHKQALFIITWHSVLNNTSTIYKTTTSDFKVYTSPISISESNYIAYRDSVTINSKKQQGTIHKVPWALINGLITNFELHKYKEEQRADNTSRDLVRFASLKSVNASIIIDTAQKKEISNMLIGIFFEDISYAADGGLYAELIQNRGFEYQLSDKKGHDATWTSKKAWTLRGNGEFLIDTVNPVHPNNKHYAILKTTNTKTVLSNEGFNGLPLVEGEKYDFSFFAKSSDSNKKNVLIRLSGKSGEVIAESLIKGIKTDWKKYQTTLTANQTLSDARIEIIPQVEGTIALDLISLFPQNTFMGRKNGLRKDLAQVIADIHPKFVRFPGGCVAHGDGLENIYHWNNTVGAVETRIPQRNIWNYHQTAGLGYFEYFQFCEDIGAEPVPVLAAGVPCQNSSDGGHGQQCGIPMNEMDAYVQEVLGLIEWANGDKNTKWGKVRADAGHPEPFNLKYIGIGNEDLISDVFEERFTLIYNAVKQKYPEIIIIGTVGPFNSGSDYNAGWELAEKLQVPMVDEHYYQTPGWFIHNQDFYDRYDRSKSKVYLGEYAAHLPGRPNNIETALSEALYLISVERNADLVAMTSYAPLLAKEGFTNWNPDLIYFNNSEVHLTTGYYVQKLFGNHSGDTFFPSYINLSNNNQDVIKRVAISVVKDTKSNEWVIKLVNLLPVSVNTEIDLSPLDFIEHVARLSVLSGKPDDKNAIPVNSEINLNSKLQYSLPAYSFSVIRFK
jgi:alpha-L-arabinofuranosidase